MFLSPQIFYKGRSSMVCFIIITLRHYRGSAIEYILHLCYIVCLEFIVPLENFSYILRCHHFWWRAANFDQCSALMAIEKWGIERWWYFNVPHLLWHRPTRTCCRTFGSEAVTTCFYELSLRGRTPISRSYTSTPPRRWMWCEWGS